MSDNTPAGHIYDALTSIAKNYPHTLEPTRHPTTTHTPNTTPQPPISMAILDVRATAHEVLAYWAGLVITGQHLHHLPAVNVHDLTAFLLTHRDYLAAHKWVKHAITELEHSADALEQIVKDSAPHQFKVGTCPGTMNGQPCPGTITATLRVSDDLLPSTLGCNAEQPHTWSSSEWRVLERRLHMDAGAARRLAAAIRAS